MRTNKELLQLLLKQVRKDFSYITCWSFLPGLCTSIDYMKMCKYISKIEYHRLLDIIIANKPEQVYYAYW